MKKSVSSKAKSAVPKVKVNHVANLAAAIVGKDEAMKVIPLSDDRVVGHTSRYISTRSIGVDKLTRKGGFPSGRLVEISGLPGVGKTTLVLQVAAQTQTQGGVVAFLDTENKLDRVYAASLGVRLDDLLIIQPDTKTVESAIVATERALTHWVEKGLSDTPLTLIWDSVAGMPTAEELENPGSKQPGVAAKLLKQMLRTLLDKVARAKALFLVTNQLYDQIGFTGGRPGVKRSTPGGHGIRYAATMRLEMVRIGNLEGPGGQVVGIQVLCKMTKNHAGAEDAATAGKFALEVMEEVIAVQRGHGTNNAWPIMQKLKEHRYITVAGGTYKFQVKGQPAVTWEGNWWGLLDLLAARPDVMAQMSEIYVNLL